MRKFAESPPVEDKLGEVLREHDEVVVTAEW